jgi:hypothetical protein
MNNRDTEFFMTTRLQLVSCFSLPAWVQPLHPSPPAFPLPAPNRLPGQPQLHSPDWRDPKPSRFFRIGSRVLGPRPDQRVDSAKRADGQHTHYTQLGRLVIQGGVRCRPLTYGCHSVPYKRFVRPLWLHTNRVYGIDKSILKPRRCDETHQSESSLASLRMQSQPPDLRCWQCTM